MQRNNITFRPQLQGVKDIKVELIDNVFQRDYGFSSPSAAASVVLGNSSNGRNLWKTADGVKLGDL